MSAAQDRRAITQTTGARVFMADPPGTNHVGTVTGHYDDDIVFVTFDGDLQPERVWTDALTLLRGTPQAGGPT